MLNCSFDVSKFQLQPCYYVHFQTKALGKCENPFIQLAKGEIIVLVWLSLIEYKPSWLNDVDPKSVHGRKTRNTV